MVKLKKSNKEAKAKFFIDYLMKNSFVDSLTPISFERTDILDVCKNEFGEAPKNLGDIVYSLRYRLDYLSNYDYLLEKDYTWTLLSTGIGQYELAPLKKLRLPNLESENVLYVDDQTPAHIHKLRPLNDQSLLMKVIQNGILNEFLQDDLMFLQAHHKVNLNNWGQAEIDGILASNNSSHLYLIEVKGYTEVIGWPQMIQLKMYAQQNHPDVLFTPVFIQSHRDWSFSVVQFDYKNSFPKVKKYQRFMFTNMMDMSTK